MANYGKIKTMKGAAIGTIVPWVGDLTEIPAGWLICNGNSVNARDYPLLVQVIGDTYGSSGLTGTFPNYTGQIGLPNIGDRALSDISRSHFVGGSSVVSTEIDTTEALGVVGTYIPSSETQQTDNGVPNTVDDAYTDINFSYTPENDFSGRLTGAVLTDGFGTKTVYTSHRKLGRNHLQRHSHPTNFATISRSNQQRPGSGVVVWGDITYRIQRFEGDEIDFSTQIDVSVDDPRGTTAFDRGARGVIIANVNGENPQYNLTPNNVTSSGLSSWFGSASISAPYGTPSNTPAADQWFNTGETIPYAPGGNTLAAPNPNHDPGGTNSGDTDYDNYKVFYNNAAISFNQNTLTPGRQDVISPHSHESFDINFDKSTLSIPNSTTVSVTSNVTPGNIDKALNITVVNSTPSLVVLYLIRAF